MSAPLLTDNHGRPLSYLRLAVTDRCNLRCFYCMPAEGIKYLPRKELLTFEEMERLVRMLSEMGINKVRITGGEPFVRRDLIDFLERLAEIEQLEAINITTNGVLTKKYLPRLKAMGINSVNLSIDTMDRQRFHEITRRDELPRVMETLHELIEMGINTKLNAVIMEGKNTDDIVSLAAFSKEHPVDVRFIEEMPFNGEGSHYPVLVWTHRKILDRLKEAFPGIEKVPSPHGSTAVNFQIPGHKGRVGIIAAFSRTFCGACNRIRLTAQGQLRTCLYGEGVLDLRQLMRSGATDEDIQAAFLGAFNSRAKDGYEAERLRQSGSVSESMSTIGG